MTLRRTWTYGVCESCLKNSHEKVEMVEEEFTSSGSEVEKSGKIWVCPVCGATKKL